MAKIRSFPNGTVMCNSLYILGLEHPIAHPNSIVADRFVGCDSGAAATAPSHPPLLPGVRCAWFGAHPSRRGSAARVCPCRSAPSAGPRYGGCCPDASVAFLLLGSLRATAARRRVALATPLNNVSECLAAYAPHPHAHDPCAATRLSPRRAAWSATLVPWAVASPPVAHTASAARPRAAWIIP